MGLLRLRLLRIVALCFAVVMMVVISHDVYLSTKYPYARGGLSEGEFGGRFQQEEAWGKVLINHLNQNLKLAYNNHNNINYGGGKGQEQAPWHPGSTSNVSYAPGDPKPVKAAFVVLARNQDYNSLRKAMIDLEMRFNQRYNYPYIFLNDQDFDETFINMTSKATKAKTYYGKIPAEHWDYPAYIDQERARLARERMEEQKVMYGGSESYRKMCYFESGLFYKHPLLKDLEYYWRLEPGVEYSCDITFDPFLFMKENRIKYGYTVGVYELSNTIPTLWETVRNFTRDHADLVPEHNSLWWVTRDGGQTYNGCHFWSNFEIVDLSFYRSREYETFFEYLSRAGGFFYERWGDAPVHSIAAALFLQKEEVHWFDTFGYFHPGWGHCPEESAWSGGRCTCEPNRLDRFITKGQWGQCSRQWSLLPDTPSQIRRANPARDPQQLKYNYNSLKDTTIPGPSVHGIVIGAV